MRPLKTSISIMGAVCMLATASVALAQESDGDLAAVDLMIKSTSWGRQGFGLGAILPTASDPALGSEKWSLGPAYVAITKIGDVQAGFLGQ